MTAEHAHVALARALAGLLDAVARSDSLTTTRVQSLVNSIRRLGCDYELAFEEEFGFFISLFEGDLDPPERTAPGVWLRRLCWITPTVRATQAGMVGDSDPLGAVIWTLAEEGADAAQRVGEQWGYEVMEGSLELSDDLANDWVQAEIARESAPTAALTDCAPGAFSVAHAERTLSEFLAALAALRTAAVGGRGAGAVEAAEAGCLAAGTNFEEALGARWGRRPRIFREELEAVEYEGGPDSEPEGAPNGEDWSGGAVVTKVGRVWIVDQGRFALSRSSGGVNPKLAVRDLYALIGRVGEDQVLEQGDRYGLEAVYEFRADPRSE